ncbi:MAG: biopolymer transporter ExbD [Candidatus Nitrotoga sp.]|nr:biopolymer transporter ExbD [Candidatus Nitrotoga sp.]RFC41175.1 MAG: outer membrane transport energization protein ExbD [Candidatus Nitrotoga sp. CP45]MDO9447838.1 biopolymer transporter ExbD [Candidatus Nitrotoga sp.]MDP1638334.1 biopolymer transporter ExbD [Candidatus Nitrotoga sp.]MDP1856437.1 biopolymer transporter ExbD [Candidatus Nitrotoga sp.]
MAFGNLSSNRQTPLADINVVPLVDVMLVLLVIFIITAPLLTNAVKIELPKASSTPNITQSEHIEFGIREDASLFWNGEPVALDQLTLRFAASVSQNPNTELHILADKHVHYENVAKVMSIAAKAGVVRIGFITDPSP